MAQSGSRWHDTNIAASRVQAMADIFHLTCFSSLQTNLTKIRQDDANLAKFVKMCVPL